MPEPGIPESFNVLLHELQGLIGCKTRGVILNLKTEFEPFQIHESKIQNPKFKNLKKNVK